MIKYLVVHHSAGIDMTRGELYIAERKRGFRDIPYNKIIHPNGKVDEGRPIGDNAANYGLNFWLDGTAASLSICIVGYFHDDTTRRQIPVDDKCPKFPTRAQLETLLSMCIELRKIYTWASVIKHSDVAKIVSGIERHNVPSVPWEDMVTACPGNLFPWERFHDHFARRLRAEGGIPNLGKTTKEEEIKAPTLYANDGTPGTNVSTDSGNSEGPDLGVLCTGRSLAKVEN